MWKTKVIELVLGGVPLNIRNFSWNINANISFQKNILLRYHGPENPTHNLVVGQSVTSQKVYQFGGVDPKEGTYFFIDRYGNSVTSLTEPDKTVVINIDPKSYGSIINSFGFKGLLLDINCVFMVRRGKNVLGQMGTVPPGGTHNQPVEVTSRWQKPGDITTVAKYSSSASAYLLQEYVINSTNVFGSASYLRIRNVFLSYRFNQALLKRKHLQNLRLYIYGQNLFTFSKYKNLDPENLSYNNYSMPPLRVITAGFQIIL